MFGLFSNNRKHECPISNDMRHWMESSFWWLSGQFDRNNIATKPMLLPTPEHFPIRYDGTRKSLVKTAEIVAGQMEIDLDEINLDIYDQNIQEFNSGFGHRMWTEVDTTRDEQLSGGLYFGRNLEGKYDIFIEKKNLEHPESLVATLAHEFAHIKLLGEGRIDENDEPLTDFTTVVFGLGIFNANTAFREHKSFDSYGHNSSGYLKQREWGYALALYAYFRNEEKPTWLKHLTANIKSDFKKSMDFIQANKDSVFTQY